MKDHRMAIDLLEADKRRAQKEYDQLGERTRKEMREEKVSLEIVAKRAGIQTARKQRIKSYSEAIETLGEEDHTETVNRFMAAVNEAEKEDHSGNGLMRPESAEPYDGPESDHPYWKEKPDKIFRKATKEENEKWDAELEIF